MFYSFVPQVPRPLVDLFLNFLHFCLSFLNRVDSVIMHNGSGYNNQLGLVELLRIGLIHSPSGRLLTSETFQGSLNVSGVSLKRKQTWTLYTESKNPTAFLLRNHLGNFLSADNNGKVTLTSDKPGKEL